MWNGKRTIDVHGHISAPGEFRGYLANLTAQRTVRSAPFVLSDDRLESVLQQRHMKKLDDAKIDYQLLGPRPVANWHWEALYLQRKWSEVTNDLIAQTVRLHPDRFAGMAQLPQHYKHDTKVCLEELDRAINGLGFVGAYLNPDPGGNHQAPGLNDEYWYPLYERAQELNAPLMIHASINFDPRLEVLPSSPHYNHVVQEYLAVLTYTNTDVFDVFPRLKIVVCHFGGALDKYLLTDVRHNVARKGYGVNLFFDTCAYEDSFVRAAIEQKGADTCMFGTEAPGAGGAVRADTGRPGDEHIIDLIDGFSFLSEEDKLKIFQANALNVFTRIDERLALGEGQTAEMARRE